ERRIQLVGPVRRADDEHSPLAAETVDLREELIDVTVVDPERLAAAAGDRVDLVDEDDRRTVLARPVEELPDVALRFTHPLADHVGSGDGIEGRPRLCRQNLCDGRLAGARRAGEEETG